MNIREAAEKAGVSARALRYYEEKGLISPVRSAENAYRNYDTAIIERIKLIHAYREMHFSLKEIRMLMDANGRERDVLLSSKIKDLEKKRSEIDHRIALLRVLRMFGTSRISDIDFLTLDDDMDAAQRSMEENVDLKKLIDRFRDQPERQMEAAYTGLVNRIARIANTEDNGISAAIAELKAHIEHYFYPCSDQILLAYARIFGGDGTLAQVLEDAAGKGAPERLRERLGSLAGNVK